MASPQFLGLMSHVKGSGLRQGTSLGPFTLPPHPEAILAEQAERLEPVLWSWPPWPILFWEAPLATGVFIHFLLEDSSWKSDLVLGK